MMVRVAITDASTGQRHLVAWPAGARASLVGRHVAAVLGADASLGQRLVLSKASVAAGPNDNHDPLAETAAAADRGSGGARLPPLEQPLLLWGAGAEEALSPLSGQSLAVGLDELIALTPFTSAGAVSAPQLELSCRVLPAPAQHLDAASLDELSSSMGMARLRHLARHVAPLAGHESTHGGGSGSGGTALAAAQFGGSGLAGRAASGAAAGSTAPPVVGDTNAAAAALEGAMAALTCLDTATTWCAAERTILTTTRLVCQLAAAALKTIKEAADAADNPNHLGGGTGAALRAAAPPFFGCCLLAFGSACGAYELYRRWLTLPKDQLARQLFGLDPRGRVAASNLTTALLGSLTGAFGLLVLIKRLLV